MSANIAVVIPTKNRLASLLRALESVRAQTLLPIEVIVVDDGSTQPLTPSIFDSFPPSVNCYLCRNETSLGASASRNIGIQRASAPYIAFLDDDDVFLNYKIEKIEKIIATHAPDLVFHSIHYHYVNEGVSRTVHREEGEIKDAFNRLLKGNIIGSTSAVVLKKSSLEDVGGGFQESLATQEDYDLWLRFALKRKKIVSCSEPLIQYNCQTQCQSLSKDQRGNTKDKAIVFQLYESYLTSEIRKAQRFSNLKESWHRSLVNYNKGSIRNYAWVCLKERVSIETLMMWLISFMSPKKIIQCICLLKQ